MSPSKPLGVSFYVRLISFLLSDIAFLMIQSMTINKNVRNYSRHPWRTPLCTENGSLKAATHDQIIRQIFESNYLTQVFDAKFDGKFPTNVFVHSVKKTHQISLLSNF